MKLRWMALARAADACPTESHHLSDKVVSIVARDSLGTSTQSNKSSESIEPHWFRPAMRQ
ncbi:hypothetical protein CHELA20_11009 [Hyphomicrobiales bacterium]|nr:hypothetical protein CHELA20_11009 [Hyphomicrobiales bacterium]CAH1694606.1 hypothetical protein CHELA41_51240 [Hyphomicrobiales bacterium]